MIISDVAIAHFRCLRSIDIDLRNYSPLVGANGAGKSTVLEAIRFVLDPRFRFNAGYLNPDCGSDPLKVTVTLNSLTADEQVRYETLARADGSIALSRSVSYEDNDVSSTYYAGIDSHGAFQPIRDLLASSDNVPAKNLYNSFVDGHADYGLSKVTKFGDIEAALHAWEKSHVDECAMVWQVKTLKELQTLGWPLVSIIYIPAVKDASDDMDAGSPLQRLLGAIVAEPAANADNMERLRDHVRKTYRRIYPEVSAELASVAKAISEDLSEFAPGSSVNLRWDQTYEPDLESPPIDILVVEDAHSSDISEKGHGVQRAVIMALISSMEKLQGIFDNANAGDDVALRKMALVLLIEEPELYQHPIRARHFAEALRRRARGDAGTTTQVVFSTHSPNFISLADFQGLRLIRRDPTAETSVPMRTVGQSSLDRVAKELASAQENPADSFSGADLLARLHGVVDTSLREGFFADSVVLVEGDNDLGPIIGGLRRLGIDYEALGLAILAANGKMNLDKPLVIFRQLGIPVYTIFDGDAGQKKPDAIALSRRANRSLARLLGCPIEDFPATTIESSFAVFHDTMDSTLRREIGDEFDGEFEKVAKGFGYDEPSRARKVPDVFMKAIGNLAERGLQSASLNQLLERITAFARTAQGRETPPSPV